MIYVPRLWFLLLLPLAPAWGVERRPNVCNGVNYIGLSINRQLQHMIIIRHYGPGWASGLSLILELCPILGLSFCLSCRLRLRATPAPSPIRPGVC